MWFCDWCLEACNYLFATINIVKKHVKHNALVIAARLVEGKDIMPITIVLQIKVSHKL